MAVKFKYNVYLLKNDVLSGEDALSSSAIDALSSKAAEELSLPEGNSYDGSEVFVFYPDEKPPGWAKTLAAAITLPSDMKTKSTSALVFVKESGRWFAIAFGPSRYFLDSRKIVMDFGLKVVVNLISDDEVRYREGMNVASSTRDASQATFATSFRALADGDRVELVKAISGSSVETGNISGATSLKFSSENQIDELHEELAAALHSYESLDYKNTSFAVIDQLAPVKDKVLIEELDTRLVDELQARSADFEIAIPELIDHEKDISFVRFMSMDQNPIPEFPDVAISNYYELCGPDLATITVDDLKRHRIEARSSDGSFVNGSSIFKCLVGTLDSSVTGEQCKYVINEGLWFRVDSDFKSKIDEFFLQTRNMPTDNEFGAPLKISVSGAKKKSTTSGYEPELEYNTRLANDHGLILMDQALVQVPGEPGRGFEICDLFDHKGKRLIHVKKSSRSSSILSHFFSQGVEPLNYLSNNSGYFEAVLEKLKFQSNGLVNASNLKQADLKEYVVHFLIADSKRNDGSFNIPFFSRITLYDRAKNIKNWAKDATISFIELLDD